MQKMARARVVMRIPKPIIRAVYRYINIVPGYKTPFGFAVHKLYRFKAVKHIYCLPSAHPISPLSHCWWCLGNNSGKVNETQDVPRPRVVTSVDILPTLANTGPWNCPSVGKSQIVIALRTPLSLPGDANTAYHITYWANWFRRYLFGMCLVRILFRISTPTWSFFIFLQADYGTTPIWCNDRLFHFLASSLSSYHSTLLTVVKVVNIINIMNFWATPCNSQTASRVRFAMRSP